MQIHEDKQVQHTASDRLQGSSGDYFVIDRAAFNQGENAQFDMQITRGGVHPDTRCKRTVRSGHTYGLR